MTMTDPIADMLTRIRNAARVRLPMVEVPCSNVKKKIADILWREGFIEGHKFIEDGKQGILRIALKYGSNGENVIEELRRISKPGRRVYVKKDKIPRVRNGIGIAIISTSSGIMTDKQARLAGVGGEVICYVV
jgi:small subunit ribosomal protein S8